MKHDAHDVHRHNIVVKPSEDYMKYIDEFKNRHGIKLIIAFSGGADDKLEGVSDESLQKSFAKFSAEKQEFIIGQAIKKFSNLRIAILTGGTKWGAPKTATQKAKECGLITIGIYPSTGKKHVLGEDMLDLSICVEPDYGKSCWGDESPIFTKLLDGVIVYGGSAGTLVEMSHILKTNEAIIKHNNRDEDYHRPKFIVPIANSGGVADGLHFVWAKTEVRNQCMPDNRIISGSEAADFLIDKLDLMDHYKI